MDYKKVSVNDRKYIKQFSLENDLYLNYLLLIVLYTIVTVLMFSEQDCRTKGNLSFQVIVIRLAAVSPLTAFFALFLANFFTRTFIWYVSSCAPHQSFLPPQLHCAPLISHSVFPVFCQLVSPFTASSGLKSLPSHAFLHLHLSRLIGFTDLSVGVNVRVFVLYMSALWWTGHLYILTNFILWLTKLCVWKFF